MRFSLDIPGSVTVVWLCLIVVALSDPETTPAQEMTTVENLTTEETQTTTMQPLLPPDEGWYTVIGSNILRPNFDYDCAVSVFPKDLSLTTVTISITGELTSGGNFSKSETADLEPSHTKIFKLKVGNLEGGKYKLMVQGEGAMNINNSTELDLQTKSSSVLVQTDRAVYKPGSKVQFRVLTLDPYLKPLVNSTILVYITDGDNNRVKEWRDAKSKQGIWSGELQLSDNPVLGDWTIHASTPNQKKDKKFEVAEYVLPKFEASIDVPQHIPFDDTRVGAQISAKYTHGGAVKGEAKITVKPKYYGKGVSKVVPLNGETVVEFDLVKDLGLESFYYQRDIEFDASVEEELTGKIQNATATLTIHSRLYNLELFNQPRFFKPGLKLDAYLKVTKFDGLPVSESDAPVEILWNTEYKGTHAKELYNIPSNGIVKLSFLPPTNATFLEIKGNYKNISQWFSHLSPAKSPSDSYLQASVVTQDPKVDSEVEIDLTMTEHSPSVEYQVLGRKGVVIAGSIPVKEGETSAKFKFVPSQEMSPNVRFIVYYVRPENGEIVADTSKIDIDYTLPNYVKVKSSAAESEPGKPISLEVESQPGSHVALLGLDQSVLLLKKGNDISKDDVMNEIKSYDEDLGFHRYSRWWHSMYNTAADVFRDAKAVVMTNALLYEHKENFHYPLLVSGGFAMADRFSLENARPMAASFGSPGVAFSSPASLPNSPKFKLPPKPTLRSKFPETWIWQGLETDESGKAKLDKVVPDTITSWVISAFSLDSAHGLGIIDQPTKIKVFRPFFISLDLPYSVIRGETVTIPVLVFNYMDTELTADVTLVNPNNQFEFGDTTNTISEQPEKDKFKSEKLTVKPNSGEKTSFVITAKELGFIGIKVTAKSDIAADAVERKLLVKAEGETQYKNEAVFVDLRKKDQLEMSVPIDIPTDHVPGSSRVEVSAVGDILGTSMSNLEKLIRMPYGCGEQNMLNFVPNIVVLDYLKNSKQLTPAIEDKCLKYMESGYQRELSYKHKDGSFSAFGNSDPSGSTWLTAFVLKSFASAEPHMKIDSKVIDEGLKWLSSKQAPNGSFPEVGTVSHKDMQGGSGNGLALTSFSLLPFLAYNKTDYSLEVEKALMYIEKQFDSVANDSYSLAISTYVLHLADHPAKEKAFELLQSNAQNNRSMRWWKKAEKKSDSENPNAWAPNSVNVEMTAYALLTYLSRGLLEDAMPVVTWLMSQQNSDGGFASTQDTVVALTGLSKLAEKVVDKNQKISVTFSNDKGFSKDVNIDSDNSIILQKIQMPMGETDKVNIKAKGHGLAVVQVSYSYNIDKTGAWPLFNLKPKVNNASSSSQLLLDICSSFMSGKDEEDESSNMVVMEVLLPSGFSLDQDSLSELNTSPGVKRVELKDADTHVVLYFDKMTKEEVCPRITAVRSHQVEKAKPVPVTVYDYYDQSRRARVFYSLPDSCQSGKAEAPKCEKTSEASASA